jgi:hypothetical protein
VFGFGEVPKLNRDGAVISHTKTFDVVLLFLLLLCVSLVAIVDTADAVWMSREGIFVNATVISNRNEESYRSTQTHTLIAFTPETAGSTLPKEVRAELRDTGGYLEGSEMSILYDPANHTHVRLPIATGDWLGQWALFLLGLLVLLPGRNLIQRHRGDIVYEPDPRYSDGVDYTPTAAEDAEFDRNQAAGTPVIMATVDGEWVKLEGEALEDSLQEDRRTLWVFMSIAILCLLIGLGLLAFSLTQSFSVGWPALVFSLFLLFFGGSFFYVSLTGLRQGRA